MEKICTCTCGHRADDHDDDTGCTLCPCPFYWPSRGDAA